MQNHTENIFSQAWIDIGLRSNAQKYWVFRGMWSTKWPWFKPASKRLSLSNLLSWLTFKLDVSLNLTEILKHQTRYKTNWESHELTQSYLILTLLLIRYVELKKLGSEKFHQVARAQMGVNTCERKLNITPARNLKKSKQQAVFECLHYLLVHSSLKLHV